MGSYTNSKDQISLEESYRKVHSEEIVEEIVDPNDIHPIVPIATTLLLIGKLGLDKLKERLQKIENEKPEKKKELLKIYANQNFDRRVKDLEGLRQKYDEAKSKNDTTQMANLSVHIRQYEQDTVNFIDKFQEHIDHHSVTNLFKRHNI